MYTLVLVRHGQSIWNLENLFTGWTDVGLTDKGRTEAEEAAALLSGQGFDFDICYTSVLKRAVKTLDIILENMDRMWLPVHKSYRLNERHYGSLQGLNKAQTAEKHGEDQVFIWRRSYDVPPPALKKSDERWPGNDVKYRTIPSDALPRSESLKDTVTRVLPYWFDVLGPTILSGRRVLIAAHGNSLRALVKYLDDMSDEEIPQFNIPTGVPLVYELDKNLKPMSRNFLGDADKIAAKAKAVADQAKR